MDGCLEFTLRKCRLILARHESISASLRKYDLRFFEIASEQNQHVADTLYFVGTSFIDDFFNQFISQITVSSADFYFYQLVKIQSDADFFQHTVAQTMLSHHDHGFEGMGKAA